MDESIPGRQPEGQEDGPPYWHNMGPHGTLISLALMLGDAKYLLRNAKSTTLCGGELRKTISSIGGGSKVKIISAMLSVLLKPWYEVRTMN
ncbi:hypothetical protein ACO22_01623 [Paracoccidioides brasiliensis]|uniref:Uncharacterized protein n=1 Tax=Paracoccidioides brasiliensis TaxID=121759 RepID=A0A1D2JL26_PARBR|nr:hypothetical protein ACO22_01623 [Paracoccidioides brasiliensis]